VLDRGRLIARKAVPRSIRPLATALAFKVVALALRGNGVHCAACGRSFRRFVAYPTLYCPGCGSYERHRQLCLWLDRNPGTVAGDVLHVGPERCIIDRYKPGAASWLSIDIDHHLADRLMDVQALELPPSSHDTVLCAHVLDVVPDVPRALGELHRVLRPGGLLLLQTPEGEDVRPLVEAGFEVETIVLDEQRDAGARRRLGLDLLPLYRCKRREARAPID
jgi:SAM-dependent methyltransferase